MRLAAIVAEEKKKFKSSKTQAERRTEGTSIQDIVRKDIENKNPGLKVKSFPTKGVDIKVRNGKTVNVEVKSARQFERTETGKRKGRFIVKPEDLKDSDLIAFVVKPVDKEFKWKKDEPVDIKYVKVEEVKKVLVNKPEYDMFKLRKNIKISLDEMQGMKKEDL